jgi:hypothetical protein
VLSWKAARTLGTQNVRTMTLKSTSSSEERSCQSADDAGADSPKKMWSGENMESFGMNSARSFLGKNVNLHLKDGSVIVNVQLGEIQKDEFKRQRFVTCVPCGNRNTLKVPLKTIAWAELLNLNLIKGG